MITFKPQDRQRVLLEACGVEDVIEGGAPKKRLAPLIGYGGAGGGGKTYGAIGLSQVLAVAYPGIQISIFRRTFKEMLGPDGVIEKSRELYSGQATYNEGKHEWTWPNGSKLYLLHCQYKKDLYKFQGHSSDVMIFDEAQHFPWDFVDYLLFWNRQTQKFEHEFSPFSVFGFNPGGIGQPWTTQIFDIKGKIHGHEEEHQKVKHTLNPAGRHQDVYFIPAFLEDNQELKDRDPEYETRMEQRDPVLYQALRFGDFSVFAGQAFREFNYDRHTCEPFNLPVEWPRWRGTDEGYTAPWCTLWLAQDPDSSRIYIYREAYQRGMTWRQQARTIRTQSEVEEYKDQEKTYLRGLTFGDPAMFTKQARVDEHDITSAADIYQEEGITLSRGDNDRKAGKKKVHMVLRNLADGQPALMIFRDCMNLISQLQNLPTDDNDPEDVNTDAEDHAYDALRYALSNLKVKKPVKTDEEKRQEAPVKRYGKML